jgi:sodium/pantothenate symporter
MIQLPAVWLSLGILGKKFAILARRYNAVTLNDMLFARYQSRLLVWLASLSLLVAFIGAMTVQFIGGARLLETAAGIPTRQASSSSGSALRCIPRLADSAPAC